MSDDSSSTTGRKVRIAVGSLLTIVVIGVGGYFVLTQTGEDDPDPNTVDAQVVSYYSDLCEAVTPVADIPRDYYRAYEQSIGNSVPGRNRQFRESGQNAVDAISTAADDLRALEDDAPRDVKSGPNDVTGADYTEAVTPLIDTLGTMSDELSDHVSDSSLSSSDEAESREAINDLGTYITGVPTTLTEGLGTAFDNAPVFSPGTLENIRASEQCAPLMSGTPVGSDVVVSSVVSAVTNMSDAESVYDAAIQSVSTTALPENPSPADASTRSGQMWSTFAADLDTIADGVAMWSNTEDEGTAAHQVADRVQPVMDELSAQYRSFADWARGAADAISETETPAVLTRTSEALSREFTDRQVDMARAQATARIDVPIPNRETLGEL